jgi:hypothetical protein
MNIKTKADATKDAAQRFEQQAQNTSWYPIRGIVARNAETTADIVAQLTILQLQSANQQQQIANQQEQIDDLQKQVQALQQFYQQ